MEVVKKSRKSISLREQSRKLSIARFWPEDVPPVAGWTINSAFWEFVRRIAVSIPAKVLLRREVEIRGFSIATFTITCRLEKYVCTAAYSARRHKSKSKGKQGCYNKNLSLPHLTRKLPFKAFDFLLRRNESAWIFRFVSQRSLGSFDK